MQHAFRTWRTSLLQSSHSRLNPCQIRPYARQRHESQLPNEDLSDDDLREIEAAVGAALRNRQRDLPDHYVKPHRRYRAYTAYHDLEAAFAAAELVPSDLYTTRQLWKAYVEARYRIPKLPTFLTPRAWDVIWTSQSRAPISDADRSQILRALARDKGTTGSSQPTAAERLARLEALFASGSRREALQQWQEQYNMRPGRLNKDSHRSDFLEIGIRILLSMKELDRSLDVLRELTKAYPKWNKPVVLDVLRALGETGDPHACEKAVELYTALQGDPQRRMPFAFYDGCFETFLTTSNLDFALRVFGDMVKHGFLASEMTRDTVRATLRYFQRLHHASPDTNAVNEVSLTALIVLPQQYHSTIFKKWLMEMATRDATDAAPQAVELMYERGLSPRSVHFNLLFALLLRHKEATVREQGENLAWQMIDQLSKSVTSDSTPSHTARPPWYLRRAFWFWRQVPSADAGTFAQLIQHYTKNFQYDKAQQVVEAFDWVESLATNGGQGLQNAAFFDARIFLSLAKGKADEVWAELMRLGPTPSAVRYGSGLYVRLWRFLRDSFLISSRDLDNPDKPERPHPRFLMAHMVAWYRHLSVHEQRKASVRLRRTSLKYAFDFPFLVAANFRLHKDIPGALVSMHVLHEVFGLQISDKIVHSFLKLLVNTHLQDQTPSERWANYRRGRFDAKMRYVQHIFQSLLRRRLNAAGDEEDDAMPQIANEDILTSAESSLQDTENEQSRILLETLSALARGWLGRQHSAEEVEQFIGAAKEDMGVGDIGPPAAVVLPRMIV